VTPYQRGFEDAKRMAVEKVTDLWWTVRDARGFTNETVNSAILSIEPPGEETHEERWDALGYRVEWSEREPRAYEIRTVGCCPHDNDCLARLSTIADVDAWIAAHGKGE
jgi:hypothetical protein